MSKMKMTVGTLTLMLAALTFWAVSATAQTDTYSLSGNARFQIGNGLPIPIGGTPAPGGRINATANAAVRQTTGADPKQLTMNPGQLRAPGNAINLPIATSNPNVFQVRTAIAISWPAARNSPTSMQTQGDVRGPFVANAGGRTGAATVTWCAGSTVPAAGNPGCTNPVNPLAPLPGIITYTAIGNQFGGPGTGFFDGPVDVSLRAGSLAPCTGPPNCLVIFANATPAGTNAVGDGFGKVVMVTPPVVPPPGGLRFGTVLANGIVVNVTSPGIGTGIPNSAYSQGAPWTTGRMTISQPAALGGLELFTLTGSDNRVAGQGGLSLVAGAVSNRGLSGPNGNRGWLNLTVAPEPAAMLGAAAALLMLGGCHRLVRRR